MVLVDSKVQGAELSRILFYAFITNIYTKTGVVLCVSMWLTPRIKNSEIWKQRNDLTPQASKIVRH